jgi:deferrochelatase/peroxidase EfeB
MSDPEALSSLARKQPALGAEPPAALSLEWRHRGDPAALWRTLQALHQPGAVLGLGAPLVQAVGVDVPGLRPFKRLQRGRFTMPATQADVWALVPGRDPGQVFERAEGLVAALAPHAALVQATPLFSYRQGHDLTGYKDGTENPTGDEAWAAALAGDGSSFVLVQRWLHFRDRFATTWSAAGSKTTKRSPRPPKPPTSSAPRKRTSSRRPSCCAAPCPGVKGDGTACSSWPSWPRSTRHRPSSTA